MNFRISHPFGVVFDSFATIVKDYVGGNSAAYKRGLETAATAYIDVIVAELLKDSDTVMVTPSTARVEVPDRVHRLHNPDIDSLQPGVFDSVIDDFEVAVRNRIVELVPAASFFAEGRKSNFVAFAFLQLLVKLREGKESPTTKADLVSALQSVPLALVETTTVETISTFFSGIKNSGQGFPRGFVDEALGVIQTIKGSGSPRQPDAEATLRRVENILMSQAASNGEPPAPVLH
jgi:hypothetical protein